ncbi:hypothetical protein K470DRAFT_219358 [Piedraia hortae CBS 480.64]|uniref:SPRY domain-containing protein n=1 Tax=Piedraia hortae CBS 480.64 TaxID=1314780 RepID=A0A6A7BVJ9_9PEZI|nr:hypothetical protein K470DRAFT_219358 [Piedraia hortae CBS 480.64]
MSNNEYAPPPGPPPTGNHQKRSDKDAPPPYDPWLVVPDNALLPPPPAFKNELSPANNASEDDAERGRMWCLQNPLWPATPHNQTTLSHIAQKDITLTLPPGTRGIDLTRDSGKAFIRSPRGCTDTLLLSDFPLYVAGHSPPVFVYYEVAIMAIGRDSGIAVGFAAPPYPPFRLPGWHRASLAVHSDDGHRYIDDPYGGIEFTAPFQKGETVGLGMTFQAQGRVEIFFTRSGKLAGQWNLYEERDREEGGVGGLEGSRDLLAALGLFGEVRFEVLFKPEQWMYMP